jgi:hypothetical protein
MNIYWPKKLKGYGLYCSSYFRHYQCFNCADNNIDEPAIYKDFSGSDYLSITQQANLTKCTGDHQLTLTKKVSITGWTFTCSKCKKSKFFDDENGCGQFS